MTGEKKKLNLLGALTDLLVFVLFVGGAGFAGYFIGINQKLAPVSMVPPGTVEAIEYIAERAAGLRSGGHAPGQSQPAGQPPGAATPPPPPPSTNPSSLPIKEEPPQKSQSESSSEPIASSAPAINEESKSTVSVTEEPQAIETDNSTAMDSKASKDKKSSKDGKAAKDSKSKSAKAAKEPNKQAAASVKKKYWVASSGNDYIGSSVTVVVNGQPVDNFFGPGKLIDVSRFVKKGPNQITFDSKVLDDEYNQHLGNDKFGLTLKVVSGSAVREDFDSSSVLLTFKRTAAEIEDGTNTLEFVAKE